MTIKNAKNLVHRYFHPVFLILIIGLAAAGSLTQKNAYMVTTPLLRWGVISWEVNTDNNIQHKVLATWAANLDSVEIIKDKTLVVKKFTGLDVALTQNQADYGFIVCYVGILLLCFGWLSIDRPKQKSLFTKTSLTFWCALVVLAGVLDILEDLGTAKAVGSYMTDHGLHPVSVAYICIPGILKWAALISIIACLSRAAIKLDKPRIWLERFSQWLGKLIVYAWRFRIVLITLTLFVLVLFISDQGQDLLITINSNPIACTLFIISTTLLALLCWHLPKAIDNAKNVNYSAFWLGPVDYIKLESEKRPKDKLDIGRLLGVSAFLIPAAGILHTMQVYKISYWLQNFSPLTIAAALLFFYTIALRHNWIEFIYKNVDSGKVRPIPYLITMAVLFTPIVTGGCSAFNREPYYLAYLSVDLIALSAAFLITTTLRTCISPVKNQGKQNLADFLQNLPIAPFITFGALAGFIFFVICNFPKALQDLTAGQLFLTMPVVFFAVGGYLLLSAYLLFIGKKTGITIITFLFIITFYVAEHTVTTYHNVAVLQGDKSRHLADSLTAYARAWLTNRKDEIAAFPKEHNGLPYPVFFVNAYGGGIRATVWTTMVMGMLDNVMLDQQKGISTPKDFRHYVFSMSGASGGTIGLAILSAQRAYYLQQNPGMSAFKDDQLSYPDNYAKLYDCDYLTADIAALLGRDLLASSIGGACWKDRGQLMEEDWERNLKKYNFNFDAGITSIWKKGNFELPLLFSNTYDVDKGMKAILAPVILDPLNFPHTQFPEQELHTGEELRLSTAAFLSARFPYVSPTGKLYGDHHFTDGGTWENAGAQTSREVEQVFLDQLAALCKKDSSFRTLKIKVSFLSLPNGYQETPSKADAKNLYEPAAPVKGLLSLIDAHELKADSANYAYTKKDNYGYYYQISPIRPKVDTNITIAPVLPLGWQISDAAMKAMAASVKSAATTDIDKILVAAGYAPRPVIKPHLK